MQGNAKYFLKRVDKAKKGEYNNCILKKALERSTTMTRFSYYYFYFMTAMESRNAPALSNGTR